VRIQTSATGNPDRAASLWRNGTQTWIGDPPQGDAQEVYATFDRLQSGSGTVGLFLRATGLNNNNLFTRNSSYIEVTYDPVGGACSGIRVRTKRRGVNGVNVRECIGAPFLTGFSSGDTLLARVNVNDDLEVLVEHNGTWTQIGPPIELGTGNQAWPTADTPHGGSIGIASTGVVRSPTAPQLDNFGGGQVR
jgi:hypothetical protein